MALERKEVAAILKRAGLPDLAAKAEAELSDPVPREELEHFEERYRLSKDWLISRMGGSP
jgi:hypothetical protein